MLRLLCFIAVLPAIFGASRFHLNRRIRSEDTKIVGGEPVTIEQFPYQCSLQQHGTHICGCSIMNTKKILTAAHCTDGQLARSLSVRAGSTNRGSVGTVKSVTRFKIHPHYNRKTVNNDVSILTLSSALSFGSRIKSIAPDNKNPQVGSKATVSGWGRLSTGGIRPVKLRAVNVTIQSRNSCNGAYGGGFTKSMICAAANGKDSCQGDSGGPLVTDIGRPLAKRKQIGIVSWGGDCADRKHPGVYTNVPYFYDFIRQNL